MGTTSSAKVQPPRQHSTPSRKARSAGGSAPLYMGAALVAGVVGALIGAAYLGDSLAALGIPDPGPLTSYGLPFVRSAATLVACLGVGSFLMSAFGAPPSKDGYLALDGYRASRTGTGAMLAWAALAVLMIPMSLSDVSGSPLSEAMQPGRWSVALEQVAAAKAWMWVAIFATIVWVGSLLTRKWIWQPIFLAVSILSLVPLALEGHSASGGNHDHGVNSLLWHIVCSALWVGGLMALVAHARRRGTHLAVITSRFSFLALFCVIALAISGVVNASLRVRWVEWFTTDYGRVILAKAILLVVLAGIGWVHRRKILPQLAAAEEENGEATPAQRAPFIRLATVEVLIMAATVGVAISLSRIPPPLPQQLNLTTQDVLLGFTLTEPPSLGAYLSNFRFDLIFGSGALIFQAGYTWAWWSIRRRGIEWPISRLLWWTLGNIALIASTCSGLGMYAMAMFAPHMIQHMALSMFIPVCWALGGPMTLLLRALPPAGRNGVPGPREWLVVFINNPVSRFLTNPIVASVQFTVGFYYLYLSSLFDAIAPEHAGHLFMMIHFIISGYIFYWVIIGVDAAPRHLSPFIKMLTLFAVVVFHAWFGIAMMQMATPLNAEFYNSLGLPFDVDLMEQQNMGGGIAWGIGEVPLLLVSVAHAVQWMRSDRKEATRYDRREARSGDQELEAYNAMLAGLATGQSDAGEREYYTGDAGHAPAKGGRKGS